jgi:NAD(P)-dependent dehydrogenase (short-subunit alcohol dehydrogenase family)
MDGGARHIQFSRRPVSVRLADDGQEHSRMHQLRFDDQVVIVTAPDVASRQHNAVFLAAPARARVMVNDAGGSMRGSWEDMKPAGFMVERIVAGGGMAETDGSDVSTTPEGAQALVDRTVERFGPLDIVVSNAGIYLTDGFPKVELDDLDWQWAVHVDGSFAVTTAAWPYLRSGGTGRVAMTTSTGAFGSPPDVLRGEGGAWHQGQHRRTYGDDPHDDRAAAPSRFSRTRAVYPTSCRVAVFWHRNCPTTGETHVSSMRWVTRLLLVGPARYTHGDLDLTAEDVVAHWEEICDASAPSPCSDAATWPRSNNQILGLAASA